MKQKIDLFTTSTDVGDVKQQGSAQYDEQPAIFHTDCWADNERNRYERYVHRQPAKYLRIEVQKNGPGTVSNLGSQCPEVHHLVLSQ